MRVGVIGAGLGGLAAAANLVRRGHDVTVLERELVPGGRAGVFAEAGFRIDTGPTMITMPELLSKSKPSMLQLRSPSETKVPVQPAPREITKKGPTTLDVFLLTVPELSVDLARKSLPSPSIGVFMPAG